jgi:hypothetical protein
MKHRITRRDFDRGALAALSATLVAGCHDYRPACPADARRDDILDGYEPRFLTRKQCLTLAAAAEVMIAACPPVISAAEVARRADFLLAAAESPSAKRMALALDVIESFAGLFSFDFRSFSELDLDTRREVIAKFVASPGVERDATRVLKLLTVVPYYSHPEVRRAIGFLDYPQRARVVQHLPVIDTSRKTYAEPVQFGPASEAKGHDQV